MGSNPRNASGFFSVVEGEFICNPEVSIRDGWESNNMDPISQGALGAIAAATLSKPVRHRWAVAVGWAGGMLADADIFIRSESDPLLNIEYHRHFSHSLVFIPLGGLICAGLLWIFLRRLIGFRELLFYATAGYSTAGLLDACTSYGTQLLWPFSDLRIAWSVISIVDPVFTITILGLLAIGWIRSCQKWAWMGGIFVLVYLTIGALQSQRATSALVELARNRGEERASRFTVKPSIGNLLVWRGIYEIEGALQVDAIRVSLLSGKIVVYEGERIRGVDIERLKGGLPEGSVLRQDLERFNHFSAGYLSWHPNRPDVISDARYAMLPQSAIPLWGIEFDPDQPHRHAPFLNFRDASPEVLEKLWGQIKGEQ